MTPAASDNVDKVYQDIVSSVANDYYDSLKNDPKILNMSFENSREYVLKLAREDVDDFVKSKQQELLSRVREEVIGEDTQRKIRYFDEVEQENVYYLDDEGSIRLTENELRAEQRQKLNKLGDSL